MMLLLGLFNVTSIVDINYTRILWRFCGAISVKNVGTSPVLEILINSFIQLQKCFGTILVVSRYCCRCSEVGLKIYSMKSQTPKSVIIIIVIFNYEQRLNNL
jgi:hypothetical protein